MRFGDLIGLLLLISVFTGVASGQDRVYSDEYLKKIESAKALIAMDSSLFGERINDYSGTVEFSVTDVGLPGNDALPVSVGRRYRVQDVTGIPTAALRAGAFADWEIDLPALHGTFAATEGWQSGVGGGIRCNVPSYDKAAPYGVDGFDADEFWHGNHLYLPGEGDDELLFLGADRTDTPRDGAAYRWATKARWYLTCLPSTANGVAGDAFLGRAPDGRKIWFDQVTSRDAAPTTKLRDATGGALAAAGMYGIVRKDITILPTRIEDRFGNWVTYTYDASNPGRLTKILAKDGRQITLTYEASGRVNQVSDGARLWKYTYSTRGDLNVVTLPDTSKWTYDFSQLNTSRYVDSGTRCGVPGTLAIGDLIGTVIHPSGAQGRFTFKKRFHGRSYVPNYCQNFYVNNSFVYSKDVYPAFFDALSISKMELLGPGITGSLVWTWSWPALTFAYEESCTSGGCPASKQVNITTPNGSIERRTFGIRFGTDEGMLLKLDHLASDGVTVLRSESTDYVTDASNQSFNAYPGEAFQEFNDLSTGKVTPVWRKQVTQQAVTFTWEVGKVGSVYRFDTYANPLAVSRFSVGSAGVNGSSSQAIEYYHDLNKWALGQVSKVTDMGTGKVLVQVNYDNVKVLPSQIYRFGQLQQTLTYNADGTLATVKDGNNRSTTLSSWYRGIPRTITFPDASTISAAVDGNGWITQVTDQLLNATGYAYDPMGRVKTVTPPIGDAVAWSPTSIDFVPVASTEYGLAAGHWRRTESRGNYRKQTFYDAYWRPVIEREYDNADAIGTQRFRGWQYDHDGKVVFDGYPLASATGITSFTAGTRTSYDALGRPLTVRQDSELGVLTTTYAYLTGFQTRVTNPRGFATTTSFQAFDTPDTSNPVVIQSPEGATTTIARDVFGKPLSVTRSGSYAGSALSVARRYVYDANERLCKRIEPESGATLFDYDGANNLVWSAEGTALTSTSCDRASVVSNAKVLRSYDAMNRVTLVDYPGTTADISSSYDADGVLRTHSSGGSVWTYTYNKLRLQTSETLVVDGKSFTFSTGYNPLAQPVSQGYPVGAAVASTVNALGQTTAITGYASGISYYPNGAIKGFTYGNGIVRTLTQNTRGLPVRAYEVKGSTAILDDTYVYDPNGNVDYITDGLPGGLTTRDLGYDGLDRLLVADSLNQWGKATYSYDPLDNLRVADQGTRQYRYNYNISTQRLDTIKTPTGGLLHSFQYNAQGDTTAKNSALYSFDAAHRLLSVANVASYSYDGHGRRIKETPQGGAAQYQVYSRAGQRLITGDITTGNRFIYLGNTLLALDNYANGALGNRVYQHTDALGSVVAKTDSTGLVTKRNNYAPYGEPYNSTIDGLGYTGHDMDANTGLVYMQQRYYDPGVGRFLSVDPVSADGGDLRHFNRYAYAYNNPYKFNDPDGRCPVCPVIIFGIGALLHSDPANAPAVGEATEAPSIGDAIADATPPGRAIGFAVKSIKSAVKAADAGKSAKFPDAKEMSKKLGVDKETFHRETKDAIKSDHRSEMKELKTKNPDVGVTKDGNVALKNPQTGKVIATETPLEIYKPRDR